MAVNYNNKIFRAISNSQNAEVDESTLFEYKQEGNVLQASYAGKNIVLGHLIGLVDTKGNIDMRYHQINRNGELMTGICQSTPEVMPNGKIRLREKWQWTSGDRSSGETLLEEVL